MEIGQVVDYIEEYNRIQGRGSKEAEPQKPNRRKATQADWDAAAAGDYGDTVTFNIAYVDAADS